MNIVIINGTHEADFMIRKFKQEHHHLTIINENPDFAEYLSNSTKLSVLVGDATKAYTLDDAHVHHANLVIALSENDIDNYVACKNAQLVFGIEKTACVVRNPKRVELYKQLGIHSVVSSTYLLTEAIQQETLVESIVKSISLENDQINVLEYVIPHESQWINQQLKDANIPSNINISCIYRNGEVIIPHGTTRFLDNDKLIMVTTPALKHEVMAYFDHHES